MDKMGSSDKAGIRGKPATPRDGSAVELIGLSKMAVRWLAIMHCQGDYPYESVTHTNKDGMLNFLYRCELFLKNLRKQSHMCNRISIGTVTTWTYKQWEEKIAQNFGKYFWVPEAPSAGELRPDLVNRRSIYKDSHGATQPWADYQLRCNFPIALVVVSNSEGMNYLLQVVPAEVFLISSL